MARRKKSNKGVQTGRNLPQNLPRRYNAYTPNSHGSASADSQPGGIIGPAQPGERRWRRVITRILLLFLVVVMGTFVFIAAWDVRNISSAEKKLFGTGNVMSLINGGGLITDQNGRVNVLVAGNSADDPGHAGATLTDSILLISMDPSTHTGYMLSIPRDLYVRIPGYGHAKINEAYSDGGMSLLQQVVEQDFGVKIGYNFLVDYSAVKDIVDALGGIDITVNSPDGKLYDPNKDWTTGGPLVDLTNGPQHLNGQQAIDFTRARGDPSPYGYPIGFEQADFQRTADQRQVVAAIKSKLNWKLILDPRTNGIILNSIASNVKTDAPAGTARPLFGLYNSIPNSKMNSYGLRDLNGKNYLSGSYTYAGDSLIPAAGLDDFSQIQAAISQLNR